MDIQWKAIETIEKKPNNTFTIWGVIFTISIDRCNIMYDNTNSPGEDGYGIKPFLDKNYKRLVMEWGNKVYGEKSANESL